MRSGSPANSARNGKSRSPVAWSVSAAVFGIPKPATCTMSLTPIISRQNSMCRFDLIIFTVGGLPFQIINNEQAARIVNAVEQRLWTPLGLRSLAPTEPGYTAHYQGGVRERNGAYHQGTVWPWLIGPFVEAWVRVRGGSADAKREARARFVA